MSRHNDLTPKRVDCGRRETMGRQGLETPYIRRQSTYPSAHVPAYGHDAPAHPKTYAALGLPAFRAARAMHALFV